MPRPPLRRGNAASLLLLLSSLVLALGFVPVEQSQRQEQVELDEKGVRRSLRRNIPDLPTSSQSQQQPVAAQPQPPHRSLQQEGEKEDEWEEGKMGTAAALVEGAFSTLVLSPEDPWIGDKDTYMAALRAAILNFNASSAASTNNDNHDPFYPACPLYDAANARGSRSGCSFLRLMKVRLSSPSFPPSIALFPFPDFPPHHMSAPSPSSF
ncbi:hypothetical protein VYU27_009450 [Nannochloropsis oceanica]